MTPPEFREKRAQESSLLIVEMEKEARAVEELFNEAMHNMDDTRRIQELKQRKKTMSITKRLKGTQDMKKLQSELKIVQTKKQERQAELEPLQEQVAHMIV
jgi:hypothetical protein